MSDTLDEKISDVVENLFEASKRWGQGDFSLTIRVAPALYRIIVSRTSYETGQSRRKVLERVADRKYRHLAILDPLALVAQILCEEIEKGDSARDVEG